MKCLLILLCLMLSVSSKAQEKDRRAKLSARLKEISVSPSGKLWQVTETGQVFVCNDTDSNWHYWSTISGPVAAELKEYQIYTGISFFNEKTSILTGWIPFDYADNKKAGLYLTNDGGHSWKLIDFGGDSWIYDSFVDTAGNAWIGGSSGDIHYSNDYGRTWKKLNSPFAGGLRTNSIFMINSRKGIAGALNNALYITTDNWKTNRKISTPLNQKKYKSIDNPDDRINKVRIWNEYIIVNQNGHIFYSNKNDIDWKRFPVNLVDFEPAPDDSELFAVTDSLWVISFNSPGKFQRVTDMPLPKPPVSTKVVEHTLHLITEDGEVYTVNKNGIKQRALYTPDLKIPDPELIKAGSKITWGISGKQLYLAEGSLRNWYRENILDACIFDIQLLTDSLAILWDPFEQKNYQYNLREHKAKPYSRKNPLRSFLKTPLQSFTISAGTTGCFHHISTGMIYNRSHNNTFTTSKYTFMEYDSVFNNSINVKPLISILSSINSNPSAIPLLSDFNITDIDKKNYFDKVKDLWQDEVAFENDYLKIRKAFYNSIPAIIDTISQPVFESVLDHKESFSSTTSYFFRIELINQYNDTVSVSQRYFDIAKPYHLPWLIEYKGFHFKCYDLAFSKFIKSCVPDNFQNKEAFDNSYLILGIADYLWQRKEYPLRFSR